MVANNMKLNPELLEKPLIEITYSELKTLRDNSQLVPGTQYRITDYVTTVDTERIDITSAGHPFDVIVVADDVNVLNENARAIQHSGDTYFANSNLEAWKLNYCLDNDKKRFSWAYNLKPKGIVVNGLNLYRDSEGDNSEYEYGIAWGNTSTYLYTNTENPSVGDFITTSPSDTPSTLTVAELIEPATTEGKGVIYRMIDEFNNDIPYDFKNIQFYRRWEANTQLWSMTAIVRNGKAVYTFSNNGISTTTEFTDFSLSKDNKIYNNVINACYDSNNTNARQDLNNICFFNHSCYNNTFGIGCYNNTFGIGCYNNTFGSNCHNNIFGSNHRTGIFITGCYNNIFGNNCYDNTFGCNCTDNTFGYYCHNNIFDNDCEHNTFDNDCYYNTFGCNCTYNTFGYNCSRNVFGDSNSYNKLNINCSHISFSTDSAGSTPGEYFYYNTIECNTDYLTLYNTTTASSSNIVQNYHIKTGTKGTSSSRITIEATRKLNYETTVALNSSGEVKTYCEADLVQ